MGLSLLGRGDSRRRWRAALAHLFGSLVGGGVLGAVIGAVGHAAGAARWRLGIVAAAALLALWRSRHGNTGVNRQVPRRWARALAPTPLYMAWGALLGAAVTTIVPYSGTWLLLAGEAVAASVTWAAVAGAIFGVAREAPALMLQSRRGEFETTMSLLPRLRGALRPVHLIVLLAAAALLLLSGCTSDSSPRTLPTAADGSQRSGVLPRSSMLSSATCSRPNAWQYDRARQLYYLALGPLHVFESPYQDRAVATLVPGRPTKVPLAVAQPIGRLFLSGDNCESGKPLTFWYGHEGTVPFSHLPVAASALASAGSVEQALGPTAPRSEGVAHIGGYMLFTSPGTWHLVLRDPIGNVIGQCTVVIAIAPSGR